MSANLNFTVPATQAAALPTPTFDYALLPVDDADFAKQAAAAIRNRLQASVIDTGRDLAAVKARLEHGAFGRWLVAEFGMNVRTAQRYMAAARLTDTKYDTVSYLPPAALYALSAPNTPEAAQDAVAARLQAGERVTISDIKDMVTVARQAAREAKVTPDQRKREADQKRRRLDRAKYAEEQRLKADEAERSKRAARAIAAADFLARELGPDRVSQLVSLMMATAWHEVLAELHKAGDARS